MSSSIETVQNLHPDPRCLKIRNMWRSTSTIIGEKRRYALADGAPTGSVFAWAPLTNGQLAGNVLYARITAAQDVLDKLSVEGAPVVAKQGEWIAARSTGRGESHHRRHPRPIHPLRGRRLHARGLGETLRRLPARRHRLSVGRGAAQRHNGGRDRPVGTVEEKREEGR